MCGILGMCSLRGERIDPRRAAAGLDALRPRGPDDEGFVFIRTSDGSATAAGGPDTPPGVFEQRLSYAPTARVSQIEPDCQLALGARRLAIQDLSAAGHQPLANDDASVWIVFNGEVYNFAELRSELEALGHPFHSRSDTEVVLRAYEEWGEDCLHRFNGMWALAIWDRAHRRLLCARDRFGVKPFYYCLDGERFAFASEIKALLAAGAADRRPDDLVIGDFVAEAVVDQTDATFFADVRSLAPGHLIDLDVGAGSLHVRRWYELPIGRRLERLTDAEHADRFLALFENAVRLRLLGDVPVGSCLSGGIDSSSIVCVVDRLLREHEATAGAAATQATFSARYDDPRHDEGRYIDSVVNSTGVDAHVARPNEEGLLEHVHSLVEAQGEPFPTTSIYAQWEVYRLARATGVVVTLDGQGGDETLGGYPHQLPARLASLLLAGRLASWVAESGDQAAARGVSTAQLRAASAGGAVASLAPAAVRQLGHRRRAADARPAWLHTGPSAGTAATEGRAARDRLQAQLHRDLTGGLRALLRFADRNSMAHSVENRLPFLDYRLVEHAFSLPGGQRIRGAETKALLRRAMSGIVPADVLGRRDKIGFSTPQDRWFRGGLGRLAREVLESSSFRARPWFDAAGIHPLLDEHDRGADHSGMLWRLVSLELWLRRYVDA